MSVGGVLYNFIFFAYLYKIYIFSDFVLLIPLLLYFRARLHVLNLSCFLQYYTGEELSDVLLYLVRMADRCHIDLAAAVKDKMKKNAAKYPSSVVRGSSKKYNEYDIGSNEDDGKAEEE